MTATMPEEDVEVAVEKAEPCFGMSFWNGHAAIRYPCGRPAVMEMMGHCKSCGCNIRRARCRPHYHEARAHFDLGLKVVCDNCFEKEVILVAVLPL